MFYRVTYRNPNNVTDRTYTKETKSKEELIRFLAEARRYSGSYNILSIEKVSEAKNDKTE